MRVVFILFFFMPLLLFHTLEKIKEGRIENVEDRISRLREDYR